MHGCNQRIQKQKSRCDTITRHKHVAFARIASNNAHIHNKTHIIYMNSLQHKIIELRNVYNVQINNNVICVPDNELFDAIESCMHLLATRDATQPTTNI